MLNEFVPTRYEARRSIDLGQLIVEELLICIFGYNYIYEDEKTKI